MSLLAPQRFAAGAPKRRTRYSGPELDPVVGETEIGALVVVKRCLA